MKKINEVRSILRGFFEISTDTDNILTYQIDPNDPSMNDPENIKTYGFSCPIGKHAPHYTDKYYVKLSKTKIHVILYFM